MVYLWLKAFHVVAARPARTSPRRLSRGYKATASTWWERLELLEPICAGTPHLIRHAQAHPSLIAMQFPTSSETLSLHPCLSWKWNHPCRR